MAARASDDAAEALRRSLVSLEREQHSVILVETVTDTPGASHARAQPVLERYHRRGTLTDRQVLAGEKLYACWALGVAGARDEDKTGSSGGDPAGYRDAQLDSLATYRRIRDAVGPRLWPVTFACCIEDFSADRWANERGRAMHPRGAIQLLRVALDMAADCLGIEN